MESGQVQSIHEQLTQQLSRVSYEPKDVFKLDVKHAVELVETEGLKSMWADKDPIFSSLLQCIHAWNGQVMDLRLNKINHINNILIQDSLHKLLRNNLIEVINTKNRVKQVEYLTKVQTWYQESLSKTQQAVMEKTLDTQSTKLNDKIYRSENYQSSLTDFWNKYRSIHHNIDPPEDRVKNYQRKNLLSAVSTTITRPGTSSLTYQSSAAQDGRPATTSEQYRMIERVQTAKLPKSSQTQKRAIQSQQGTRNHPSSDWLSNQHFPVFEAFETKPPKQILAMQRSQSPLKFDKPFDEDSPLKPSTARGAEEPNKSQFFNFEPQQQQKMDKLFTDDAKTQRAYDDFSPQKMRTAHAETQSNYLLHDPLLEVDQEAAMLRMQEKYHKNRNTETRNKREDEELLNTIQEWANNRGRVNEMMTQKTETLNVGSKYGQSGIKMSDLFMREEIVEAEFDEVEAYQKYVDTTKPQGYLPLRKSTSGYMMTRPHTSLNTLMFDVVKPTQVGGTAKDFQEKVVGLEQQLKLDKLARLKQSRGSLVPGGYFVNELGPLEMQRLKQLSSSSYSRPQTSIANRPFSGIYKRLGQKTYVNDAINEVLSIKKVLVRTRTAVSVRTLQRSLIIPAGLPEPHTVLLPGPGSGLSDPPEMYKASSKALTKKKKKR